MQIKETAVIIPAFNEEIVLRDTLLSVRKIVDPDDIYVIDDGSKDNTYYTARKITKNVLRVKNSGKASALNLGIKNYHLTKRYKYIMFIDADTQPASDFLEIAIPILNSDEKVDLVVGRVQSYGNSWIEKYRLWEYQISHFIHKQAQAAMSAIIVVPGCATVYRSPVFEKLQFPTGTLTEDMDFTFLMHRNGYNRMIFAPDAVVYTQDPNTLKDFIKQVDRWYTGFWQAVKKHDIPWGGQSLDFEAALMALEGLYNGILASVLLFLLPSLLLFNSMGILKIPLLIDIGLFFIPSLIWSAVAAKNPKLILYIFHFYFLRFLSSLIFIRSFFRGYSSKEKLFTWDTRRYLQRNKNYGHA